LVLVIEFSGRETSSRIVGLAVNKKKIIGHTH